jgi:hypothetical protein
LTGLLAADRWLVDLSMATVAAGIGLHLAVGRLIATGGRALLVGGGTSAWMAGFTLLLVTVCARGHLALAALCGCGGVGLWFALYRLATRAQLRFALTERRFRSGAPLSLGEATELLSGFEAQEGGLDEARLKRLLNQLHPSIGELIPVRESPLGHGEGCRWITYWQGRTGWALVAVCREPGSATPIHAHPHRLIGKAIEGAVEELRFSEGAPGQLRLDARGVLSHNDLVETDGLDALHVVRVVSAQPAIDLQLRGPELGRPGRMLCPVGSIDVAQLSVGDRLAVTEEIDSRPGQGGEGADAGRPPAVIDKDQTG